MTNEEANILIDLFLEQLEKGEQPSEVQIKRIKEAFKELKKC